MIDTTIGPREAPEHILDALREIDRDADLVHLEGKRWWLGVRAPNPGAEEALAVARTRVLSTPTIDDPAERALEETRLARELKMRRIMAEGFRPVALYVVNDDTDLLEIVEDFRIRDFNFRTKSPDQIQREFKRDASLEERNAPRIRQFAEYAREKAAEAFRYVFQKARSFGVAADLE